MTLQVSMIHPLNMFFFKHGLGYTVFFYTDMTAMTASDDVIKDT